MEAGKTYRKPKEFILNTIYDIIELQNGEIILTDVIHGRIHYHLTMYGYVWELLYTVTSLGEQESEVTLKVLGERRDKEKELRRGFALLDSMIEGGSEITIRSGDADKDKKSRASPRPGIKRSTGNNKIVK